MQTPHCTPRDMHVPGSQATNTEARGNKFTAEITGGKTIPTGVVKQSWMGGKDAMGIDACNRENGWNRMDFSVATRC